MNFAEMLLKATREQASKQIENSISDIYIGTMSGTDGVTLENGYTVSGDMLLFTQFCYDQVIELPHKDHADKSHHHNIHDSLDQTMVASPTGLCAVVSDSTSISQLYAIQARINAGDPTALADMAAQCAIRSQVTTALTHSHTEDDAMPRIRLWRGVKDGDKVLVIKVNTRHFVVLCRLGLTTNEEDSECKGYVSFNT